MGGALVSEKDTVASDTTISGTFEDVDGLTVSITTANTSNILIVACIQASCSTDAVGSWRLVFDSVNFLELDRQVNGTNPGNLLLADLVIAKGSGTYTLKLQHKVTTGTLTSANISLHAIELHNGDGAVPSSQDYVASDTVGSSWADITGLSTQVTLDGTSHILAILVANAYFNKSNKDSTWAINIDSTRMEEQQRDFLTLDQYGCISLVTRTATALSPGTYTIKGEWKGAGGSVLTGEDFTLIAIAAEANSGADPIDIQKDVVASDTTTATSIEDIDGLSVTADLPADAHVLSFLTIDSDVSVANTSAYNTISIDAVDYMVMERGHSSAQQHGSICHCVRTDSVITSSTAIVKGRWYTDATNTLTGNDIVLTSIVLYAGTVSVTPKGFSDTIDGADVFETATILQAKSVVDTIAGADIFDADWKALFVTDSGAGGDVFAKFITFDSKEFVDAILGTDVFENLYREMAFADSISGADVWTVPWKLVLKAFADVIDGTDVWTLTRPMNVVDTIGGADVFSKAIIFQSKGFVDSVSGADVFGVFYRELGFADTIDGVDIFGVMLFKGFTDTVGGVDVWTLTRPVYMTDTITGSDVFTKATTFQTKSFIDSLLGSDVFANPYREMGFVDTVAGTDVFTLMRFLAVVDTLLGTDVFTEATIFQTKEVSDSVGGADVFENLYREMSFSDTVSGVDVFTMPLAQMGFADVILGTDVFESLLWSGLVEKFMVDTGHGFDVFAHITLLDFTDAIGGTDVFLVTKPEVILRITDGDFSQILITDGELSQVNITMEDIE